MGIILLASRLVRIVHSWGENVQVIHHRAGGLEQKNRENEESKAVSGGKKSGGEILALLPLGHV